MEQEPKIRGERAEDLIRLLVPDWRPTPQQVLWAVRIVIALIVVLSILTLIGQLYDKTLWDLAQLLIVPAVIAGVGIWFNQRQQHRARQYAERLAQDNALQTYLEAMSDLMIKHQLRRSESSKDEAVAAVPSGEDEGVDNARAVAQSRTLTVLMTLSSGDRDVAPGAGVRKGSVLRFLYDADLITKGCKPLVLSWADLSNIELGRFTSQEAARVPPRPPQSGETPPGLPEWESLGRFISQAARVPPQSGERPARLSEEDAYLIFSGGVILNEAYLPLVNLRGAYLKAASLLTAHLRGAYLSGANLSDTDLRESSLERADLSGADLSRAWLDHADLREANLTEANLSGADLRSADLNEAKGWTEAQLLAAESLEGATMPDGQRLKAPFVSAGPTLEEWLKSKGRKDGENE